MSETDFKASLMVDKSLLKDLINHLRDYGEEKKTTSKYQLALFSINRSQVLIYQSGIVIFEDTQKTRDAITDFLELKGIGNTDFEQYQAPSKDTDTGDGWDETPKGVWLTSDQIEELIDMLSQSLELVEGGKHERGRFLRDDQILVINNNGVVYTIGGFDGILELLRDVITERNPYHEYDRIVIIDEQGRWERLGPVCLTLVDIKVSEVIELQLKGVKDDSLSRNIDHLELMPYIEQSCSYQVNILTPADLNETIDSREDYREFLHTSNKQFLHNQLLNLNQQTLLIVDDTLSALVEHDHKLIVPRNDRTTPAIGISSTITNAMIEKWKQDWYKKLGFSVDRNNLVNIREHPQKFELAKLLLL